MHHHMYHHNYTSKTHSFDITMYLKEFFSQEYPHDPRPPKT